jgi:hypothetical protein
MLSPAIAQTSNDVRKIYDIVYDVVYDVAYYIVYDVVYYIVYYVVYDVVCDVTRFIQPAARLLHQPMLLPSDGASKLQLLYALILEHAPGASRLHP